MIENIGQVLDNIGQMFSISGQVLDNIGQMFSISGQRI
jgi:hypothetical protein